MLRLLLRLLGLADAPEPHSAPPPLPGTRRLHLFSGTFGSEMEAMAYVMPPMEGPVADAPAQLTIDLPDAMIDPAFVEMGHGPGLEPLLQRRFTGETLLDVNHMTAGADTVVLIDERAMGGLPYTLESTPRLHYHGAFELPA